MHTYGRGMAAAAGGLSATTTQGQQLWTTLLLAIANIVLTVNVWGHAREQAQAAQAKADSKVALRQVGVVCVVGGVWVRVWWRVRVHVRESAGDATTDSVPSWTDCIGENQVSLQPFL